MSLKLHMPDAEEFVPFDEDTEVLAGGGEVTYQREPGSVTNSRHSLFGKNLTRAEAAECFVIGAALKYTSHAAFLVRHLAASDFVFTPARIAYQAIADVLRQGREVNYVSVMDSIVAAKEKHNFPENNPAVFIAEVAEFCGAGVGMEYNCGLVRELASKRQMLVLIAKAQDAAETREPASQITARYARDAASILARDASSKVVTLAESVGRVEDRIDRMLKTGTVPKTGLPVGIPGLDSCTGGFQTGQLVILAARPSVGKSALAGLCALNVSRDGGRVLFFSLEMSETELTERMLAMSAGVPMPAIRGTRRLDDFELDALNDSIGGVFRRVPFAFVDRRGLTAEALAADARAYAMANEDPVRFIVVDYLQLLKAENPRDPRHLQVGYAAKTLRNLAGELKCPVLCLAQLNREVESRGGEPRLSDLRDSGEIEQDADVVLLLHRTTNDPTAAVQDIDLIIAKNRNGPTGKVDLAYTRALTKFTQRQSVPM